MHLFSYEFLRIQNTLVFQSAAASLTSPSETWGPNANWTDHTPNIPNSINHGQISQNNNKLNAHVNNTESLGNWDDGDFEPIDEINTSMSYFVEYILKCKNK